MDKIELNGFKKYDKLFKFMVGDVISYNGAVLMYNPCENNKESRLNIPRSYDHWYRSKSVEVPFKIKNHIIKTLVNNVDGKIFENLELKTFTDADKAIHRYYQWIVTSVNEEDSLFTEEEKEEELELYSLTLTTTEFKVESCVIEKETPKQIMLKGQGLYYKNRWTKDEINKITTGRYSFSVTHPKYECVCKIEEMDKLKDKMFMKLEKSVLSLIELANKNSDNFEKLKTEQGY